MLWLLLIKDQPQPSLGNKPMAAEIGLPVLNGELFALQALDVSLITNRDSATGVLAVGLVSGACRPVHRGGQLCSTGRGGTWVRYMRACWNLHPALDRDAAGRPSFDLILGAGRKEDGFVLHSTATGRRANPVCPRTDHP